VSSRLGPSRLALLGLALTGCGALLGQDFSDYRRAECSVDTVACDATGGGAPTGGDASGGRGDNFAGQSGNMVGGAPFGGATGGSPGRGNLGEGGEARTGHDSGVGGDSGEAGGSDAAGASPGVPSCVALSRNCGPAAVDDCCATDAVLGGSFTMGRNSSPNAADQPEHLVTVLDFKLDRYEATVGRFRAFVAQYDAWKHPTVGAGAYAGHPGSGWDDAWNAFLQPDAASLINAVGCENDVSSAPGYVGTWSEDDADQALAISCLDWYTAYAFCIWDEGRLPTEAEWEYAAAGGTEEREYPWVNLWTDPSIANYDNYLQVISVGEAGAERGRGRFGQYDLTGNVWEWVRDDFDPAFYSTPGATGVSPLNIKTGDNAILRGASFFYTPPVTTTTFGRQSFLHNALNPTVGVRCARD
jgi:sulfatase modifying factor 1